MDDDVTRKVILLNGLPATGKTTIGEQLSDRLNAPLISLDTIKEAMFDVLGTGDREYNRLLGRACKKIIWALIADLPDRSLVIIDAWFGRAPHDDVVQALAESKVSDFVEIWCHAPGEVLKERYIARIGKRHAGHPGIEYGDELQQIAAEVAPMAIGALYAVETSDMHKVDINSMICWVREQLRIPIMPGDQRCHE